MYGTSNNNVVVRNLISDLFQPAGKYSEWYKHSAADVTVWACGHAHYERSHYCGRELARVVADNVSDDWDRRIKSVLKRLNGNWALVVQSGNLLYAAVDRTRSFPLLYKEVNGELHLSDDFTKMCGDGVPWCSEAVVEFLWSGYPAGTLTLGQGVHQIPAGTFLRYDGETKEKSLDEYFSFLPMGGNPDSDERMSETLATLLDESVRRVGESLRGRIVLPLSGGMDSRAIAAAVKRNGFDNVVCFSYGRKGNPESAASRRIAEALNYEWHFVEYSPATWSDCMFSREMKEYLAFACNGCSMPVFSNWYAVRSLRQRGIVSEADAFVPGHTGDFLTGGHIPQDLQVEQSVTQEHLLSLIMKKHFSRWPGLTPDGIGPRLSNGLPTESMAGLLSNVEAAGLCDLWIWKERQAKMIINSSRIYEHFGFSWFTPLWDSELIDFYLTVPFRLRCKRRLFLQSCIEHVFSGDLAILGDIPLAGHGGISPRQRLILASKTFTSSSLWRKAATEARRLLVRHLGLAHLNHALCLRDCFAGVHDHGRVTIRRMLEAQGLNHVLSAPECDTVLRFVDKPIGQVNAYATLSLYVVALLYGRMREAD